MRLFVLFVLAAFSTTATWAAESVVVIKLRAPRNQQDARFDPYFDLGREACFGITGCHRSNIMHPLRIRSNLLGRRVAFVQQGFDAHTGVSQQRLVFLTPVLGHRNFDEVGTGTDGVALLKWNGLKLKPLKFASAPILVSNDGRGVPELVRLSASTRRSTPVAGFGSLFRTRVEPLPARISLSVVKAWAKRIEVAETDPDQHFAKSYSETMSPPPDTVDTDRNASFQQFFERAVKAAGECEDLLAGR